MAKKCIYDAHIHMQTIKSSISFSFFTFLNRLSNEAAVLGIANHTLFKYNYDYYYDFAYV